MKTLHILAAAATLCSLAACDNIDEKDRFIPVERPHSDKTVLIEEFTGANCNNCPEGAAAVAALHETYGDNVIAVAEYPNQMPQLTNPPIPIPGGDLRTQLASDYFSAYDGPSRGLPSAMFDRTKFDGRELQLTPSTWGTPVYNLLQLQSPVNISMTCGYDESTRKLNVDYSVEFVDGVKEPVSYQLWLVENGIITVQADKNAPGGIDPAYENNHVLRAALNGTWGTAHGDGHLPAQRIEGSGSITLDNAWKAENCQVVGFLFYTDSRRVIQASLLKSIYNQAPAENN